MSIAAVRRARILWLPFAGFAFALLLLATLAQGQNSVAVNAANTHQTWHSLVVNIPQAFGVTGCPAMSNATYSSFLGQTVNDLGANGTKIPIYQGQNLDKSGVENSATVFTTPYNAGSGCTTTTAILATNSSGFRNLVLAARMSPEMQISMFFYGVNTTTMPSGWVSSVGTAASQLTSALQWFRTNYGWYPDYITWNEPDYPGYSNSGGFFQPGGGAADWYGGWINAQVSSIAAAGVTTKIMSPTPVCPGYTVPYLNAIANVAGAEQNISRIAYHLYNSAINDTDGNGTCTAKISDATTIYLRAAGNGQDVRMDEYFAAANGTYSGGQTQLNGTFFPYLNAGHLSSWDMAYVSPSTDGCQNTDDYNFNVVCYDQTGDQIVYLPAYYVMRQFFRYVKPGYINVDATSNNASILTSAWKRPSDGGLIIVMSNTVGGDVSVSGVPNVSFTVNQLDASMCTASGQARCTPSSAALTASGGSLTLSAMPAGAVWTLVQGTGPGPGGADFSLSINPASVSIAAGQAANFTLTVTPINGFNQSISLACGGAPAATTCTPTPASVTLDGLNPSSVAVSVATTGRAISPLIYRFASQNRLRPWVAPLLFLCAFVLTRLRDVRPGQRRLFPSATYAVAAAALVLLAMSMIGCTGGAGNGGPSGGGTPAGSYTIIITGTSGGTSHSVTATLKVS